MVKYNYCKAAKIWADMTAITFDMSDFFDSDRQADRRFFMRALTRGDSQTINSYIDYITDYIADFSGTNCLTTEDQTKLEKIALQIVLFTNDNNY